MPKYTGMSDLKYHVAQCMTTWKEVLNQEWMQRFIHMLEEVPRNWYSVLEVCRGTTNWEELIQNFKVTFTFEAQ